MDLREFNRITDRLDSKLHGEGYYLNIRTRSGHEWRDYTWSRPFASDSVLELSRDGSPPVWLPVSQIESIELSEGL